MLLYKISKGLDGDVQVMLVYRVFSYKLFYIELGLFASKKVYDSVDWILFASNMERSGTVITLCWLSDYVFIVL